MIPLALAHCLLQPLSKQGTNGGAFLGSENTSFPQKFRFDFQCNIGLHICTHSRAALFYVLSSGRSTASTARRELRIVVLDSPSSFESELAALGGVEVIRDRRKRNRFSLAFVTTPERIDALAPKLAPKAEGDAIVRKHCWGQRKPPPLWTQSLCSQRPSCVPTHTLAKRLWIDAYDALTMAHP